MTDEARQFSYPHCNRILNIGVSVQYRKKKLMFGSVGQGHDHDTNAKFGQSEVERNNE